ncbi:hypothetical protein [Streptomyces sp. enrichment culture]|uniref:hypothetical protein n=1 Tax=Streptomyces sp. enrichment culture TaxID=1795815 RepID=UPI003F577962
MTGPPAYQVHFTEPAAAVRDRLDARRRARFEQGVALLTRDPFPDRSRSASAMGADRTIRLTRDTLVRYTVDRARLTVLYVAAFDDGDVLVAEE